MLQNGEITVTNSGGATIILRTSGNIELNGNTDSAIAFTDMKLAFDTLRTELNAFVSVFNAHVHTATMPGPGVSGPIAAPAIAAVADMTAAEVPTVKVP